MSYESYTMQSVWQVNGGVDVVFKQKIKCKSPSMVSEKYKGSSRIGVLGASGYTGSEVCSSMGIDTKYFIVLKA